MTERNRGRPASSQPKTAYDMRRYITLVQVLAAAGCSDEIQQLCDAWGVEPVEDRSTPPYKVRHYISAWGTLRKLAQHVIEYHRADSDDKTNRRCGSCGRYTARYIGIQHDGGEDENVTVHRWDCPDCSETFDEPVEDDTDVSQRD